MTAAAGQGPLYVLWATCLADGVDHAVLEEVFEAAGEPRSGPVVRAVCGGWLAPAPLVCTPRPPCPRCAAVVRGVGEQRAGAVRLSPPLAGMHPHRP